MLAPKLVGESVGLHPVWLMFALFAFGYLFGFVGLLVAVPLAAAIGVLVRFALAQLSREPALYRRGSRPERAMPMHAASAPARARARSRRELRARGFPRGPSNAAALALIERWPDWPSRAVLLVGPEGSGKSHLAAIWAQAAGARFVAARALDERQAAGRARDRRAGGRGLSPPARFDERALFHLLNLAREDEAFVLITARTRARRLALRRPRSRLAAQRCRSSRWRRPTTRCCARCWSSCSPTASSRSTRA